MQRLLIVGGGWEREIQLLGAEAKRCKQAIMTERIAPPTGSRAEIFAAACVDPA